MAMGRGSDTRIYAPRSESDTMYSSANEDESRYGPSSSYDKEKRMDERKEKEESRKTKLKDIKHIKIKPSQGLSGGSQLETESGLDDGDKRDDEREIGLQGGPAGSRGTLLDLATGAKSGTGSSMGSIMASEPMDNAWSELLKRETPSTMSARRRREKRQEFRPSTGQFKTPPGGMSGGAGATMRRFKGQMRGIKGSKKTGLMKPHLSVEMSHRGIATKQPMSKDPQKYGQYMGQSEARKRLGNVRTVFSPHARHSARSFNAGPTGAGRLSGLMPGQQGLMSRPSLQRMRAPRPPRMPRVRRPPMPMAPQMAPPMSSVPSMPAPSSSMMMSEDRNESDFLKSNRHAGRTEYLKLMRELMRLQRERLNKAGTASAFEEGAVPAHPAGVHQHEDEDEKNDGPTQNLETNSSRMGLDPAGYLVSRRGHMG